MATELEKEMSAFGSVIKAAEKLQREITAFVEARRDLCAAGVDTQDAVPAMLQNGLLRFLAKVNEQPEPSHKERRVTELKANIERAGRVIDLMKQSGDHNDPATQQHKRDVQRWILKDSIELANLQKG